MFKGGYRKGNHEGPSFHISLKTKTGRAGAGAFWYDWNQGTYSADGAWSTLPVKVREKAKGVLRDFVAALISQTATPVPSQTLPGNTGGLNIGDHAFGTYAKTVNEANELDDSRGEVPDYWDA